MKQVIINEIMQGMVKHLDNSQMKMLYKVLEQSFLRIDVLGNSQFQTNQTFVEVAREVVLCGDHGRVHKIEL